jgi:hypothetical protein
MFTFKNLVAALALTGLASAPAFALNNAGFETGDASGWLNINSPTLSAASSLSVLLTDERDPSFALPVSIAPVDGSYFGVMTMPDGITVDPGVSTAQTWSFNLTGAPSAYGDMVYLRLISADYFYQGLDDEIAVTYDGGLTDRITAADILSAGYSGDSGWLGFAVPTGTQNVYLTLTNFYDASGSNTPIAAIDYVPAAVPENSSLAMLGAGLGALALVGRRRRIPG